MKSLKLHFDDGGKVTNVEMDHDDKLSTEFLKSMKNKNDVSDQMNAQTPSDADSLQNLQQLGSVNPPDQPTPEATPQDISQPTPQQAPMLAPSTKGLEEQRAGVVAQGNAESAGAQKEAQISSDAANATQQQAKTYEQNSQAIDAELKNSIQDIHTGQIDPDRYWNNMGTTGKIATTIGLIVGGLGRGLTGSRNLPLEILNKHIDDDIEAQKSQLGQKKTVLEANLNRFQNLNQATKMTQLMGQTYALYKLHEAAAQTNDPVAKARALQLVGGLDQQIEQSKQQLALQQTLLGGNVDPAVQVRLKVPEKQQPEAYKALDEQREIQSLRNNVLQSIDKIGNSAMTGAMSPRDTESAKQAFIGKLIKLSEGRFNQEAAQNLAAGIFPRLGDAASTIKNKRARAQQLFDSLGSGSVLDAYGIKLPNKGSYNAQGQSRFQESKPVSK
jgi:hypothetical protein